MNNFFICLPKMEGCRNLECILFLLFREQAIYFLIFRYNQPIFKSSLKLKKKKKKKLQEEKKKRREGSDFEKV